VRVRLGYVAIALSLPKTTASSTVTVTNYKKLNEIDRENKLKKVTLSNLDALYSILNFNVNNYIHFYRITSNLVPLATHPEFTWNYRRIFNKDFQRIGKFIQENKLRVDTHPDQFNVLNSLRDEVVESTVRNLYNHVHLFEDINYPLGKMIIHVGGKEGGKAKGIERFKRNFVNIPNVISSKLLIENDDRSYTAKEVLRLCKDLSIPMVFDIHHHKCNNEGEDVKSLIKEIFKTWENEALPPKIHFSSPKEGEFDRKHSDYINPNEFIEFIDLVKDINIDFDIMIEAKLKDLALFNLVENIKQLRPDIKWIDSSTFEV
jgi:UV DNA damage endonuclease